MTTPITQSTPAELAQFKARYIETADRSWINEKFAVRNLPEHLHGEWHGTDSFSQLVSRNRGFVDGSQYLTEDNIMHITPEGGVVGDVKFMVIEKAKYLMMKEVDDERARKQSGIGYADEDFKNQARSVGLGVQEKEVGTTQILRGDDVVKTIKQG